jgi:uncharacterized membrane protein SpoIIM required for sporulation
MQETIFLKKNGERWLTAEAFVKKTQNLNPDQLAKLFVELTDDLAYAQTHFPNSKTTKYINQLSLQVHHVIYSNNRKVKKSPLLFFKETYPLLIFKNRFKILYSFLIITVAAIIGALSSSEDESFIRFVLGDHYVNMTIENIEDGTPLAVYDQESPFNMFLRIAWNNIKVSFFAYAAGALISIGTIIILFKNGLMLGVFQFFFYTKGLFLVSSLGIWLHGTVEIFSIIVAGAAGMVLGNSILFPGTFSRIHSLRKGALEGVKMVMGLVPFFIIAAFIESYVTRHSDYSQVLDIILIAISVLTILFYFIIYPVFVNKTQQNESD